MSKSPSISVVCVTRRTGAIDFLLQQLDKQTFQDFEIIIADDSHDTRRTRDARTHIFTPRPPGTGDAWNLNKAYNDAFAKASGELIVFLQDYIWVPANGLERFWDLYGIYPNDLITGCGHKYENNKIQETDDRCYGERELVPSDWTFYELNYASCPRKLAPLFEEDMDHYYGGENQIFALQATQKGAKIWLDRTNECKGEIHKDRPEDWEEKHSNKKGRLNTIINNLLKK